MKTIAFKAIYLTNSRRYEYYITDENNQCLAFKENGSWTIFNAELVIETLCLIIKQSQETKPLTTDISSNSHFYEWVEKYFKTPKMKMMYERKDGKGEYDKADLIRMYNRAFVK